MTPRSARLRYTRDNFEKLARRVSLLEDINHSMAHNIRGAAGSIKMMNDFLMEKGETTLRKCDDGTDSLSVYDIVHCVGRSSESLLATLDDMMELVNKELHDELKFVECDIAEVSDGVVRQLCGTVLQKRAKIIYNFAARHFRYARTYLENILYNLVSNALKYSRPGEPPVVMVSSVVVDGHPVIEVADNGLGIDLAKCGKKMFGLNQVFHKGYDSKGIGLYITRRQVESLGGKISVESEVNRGTKFRVVL